MPRPTLTMLFSITSSKDIQVEFIVQLFLIAKITLCLNLILKLYRLLEVTISSIVNAQAVIVKVMPIVLKMTISILEIKEVVVQSNVLENLTISFRIGQEDS